jgi:GT2 family glycosyltransferase
MKTIGVMITNYKAWPLTEKAIQAVLQWSGNSISKIIVVDDASDAPATYLGSDKVVIHRNRENMGYVRSVNVGMRLFTEDIVLFLDCDAYPLMDLTPALSKRFEEEPRLGALGFFERGENGKAHLAGEYEPTLMNFLLGQSLGQRCADKGWFIGSRYILYSCCMAVRREAFEQIHGFDEAFDFLDGDTDFSMRLQDAGWEIKTDSALQCFHRGSGSPQATSRRVVRHHYNRWMLLRKHGKVQSLAVCRMVLKVRHLCEWGLLKMAKAFRLRPANEVEDKIFGRAQLIRTVGNDYSAAR